MDLQQVLDGLANTDGHYAREAVSEAIRRREEITPALLNILENVLLDPAPYFDNRRFDHIYAMYLLAQFREARAYPLLVKIFSAPGEFAFELVDYTVTEGLGKILASVSCGDTSGMSALIENERTNEYVRAAALTGLTTLVACGELDREQLVDYLKRLFQTAPRTPEVMTWIADACLDIWPEEFKHDLRKTFDDGLIAAMTFDWDDVEQALAVGLEPSMSGLRYRYKLVTDLHKEMSWWYCFPENRERERRALIGREDNVFSMASGQSFPDVDFEPIFKTEPLKIGRNEPCSCGSGKKYKKCCGA